MTGGTGPGAPGGAGEPLPLPGPGIVDLYLVRIADAPIPAAALPRLLPPAELERAARFRREEDRVRQRTAAAVLRLVLGAYLARPPASLSFLRGTHGKPALEGGPPFNLSHSGDWVAVAVAGSGRVGVDVEALRPLADLERLAASAFAPEEVRALRALPETERTRAFYRTWTRKEAFVKAVGAGLSLDLASFCVSAGPGPRVDLLRVDDPGEAARPWAILAAPPAPDAEAAVAWDGGPFAIRRPPPPALPPRAAV